MAMTIHVDIVSAEKEIYSGPAEMVFAPAELGEVGITPRHTPFMAKLRPGSVRVQSGGEEQVFYVSAGLLEVQPHVVTVLAETALRAKDIDQAAALQAKEHAERALADKKSEIDYAQAQSELAQSIALLRTLEKARKKT